MAGTGLALNLVLGTNNTGYLLLSHQTANQELCLADFNESRGWTFNEGNPISELPTERPLPCSPGMRQELSIWTLRAQALAVLPSIISISRIGLGARYRVLEFWHRCRTTPP